MLAWLGDYAGALVWWVAVAAFLCCALGESLVPDRRQAGLPTARWAGHFALYAASICLTALMASSDRISALLHGDGHGPLSGLDAYGGDAAALVVGMLTIDLFFYAVHRLHHGFFVLWRFHAVHHADNAVDASTALRHHPLEYQVNVLIGGMLFAVLGLPPWVLACYGVLALTVALFQHMNIRVPLWLEPALDLAIVGPAFHRAHHSSDPAHHNVNFGNVFTVWDRMFGTYCRLSRAEHSQITFGVAEVNATGRAGAIWAWVLPFLIRRRPRSAPRLT